MTGRCSLRLFTATIASLLGSVTVAQAQDAVAFHPGQWGAEFQIGNGFVGTGALHFSSPTRALLINVGTNYTHASASGAGQGSGNATDVTLDLGTRRYHSFGPHLYRLITFGLSANYQRQSSDLNNATVEAIGGGPFVDLGASWMVTAHLALGARWRAALAYDHVKQDLAGTVTRINRVSVSLGGLSLAGQLYF